MKLERVEAVRSRSISRLYASAVITFICIGTYIFFADRRLNHDIAWIIEACRRWLAGGRLYVDIIDVNPPLIFYETVALTGGQLTQHAYIAGVCVVMALSALWVLRLREAYLAMSALAAMVLGGVTDFGQRDHLALIFVVPFLLGERAGRAERIALGLWAFVGVGLKPYLLFIPAGAVLARCMLSRSVRPLISAEFVSLGVACVLYAAWVTAAHSVYLTDIVPLGQFTYSAYGASVKPILAGLSVSIVIVAATPLLIGDRERIPLALATLGALASFYLQGRNWTYHFVPAIGLGILLTLWSARQHRASGLFALILAGGQLWRGPYVGMPPSPIPQGTTSVAFLSAHVWSAYPTALDCGIRNEMRYPALWLLPGAWNILHDPAAPPAEKVTASNILSDERELIRGDLLAHRPQIVFADARREKKYFKYPFDYVGFLGGLPGYQYAGRVWLYDIWTLPNVRFSGRRCGNSSR